MEVFLPTLIPLDSIIHNQNDYKDHWQAKMDTYA